MPLKTVTQGALAQLALSTVRDWNHVPYLGHDQVGELWSMDLDGVEMG